MVVKFFFFFFFDKVVKIFICHDWEFHNPLGEMKKSQLELQKWNESP